MWTAIQIVGFASFVLGTFFISPVASLFVLGASLLIIGHALDGVALRLELPKIKLPRLRRRKPAEAT